MLPTLLFSFAIAVDVNTMVVAQNEVTHLAYAAAVGGAGQYSATLDQGGLIDTANGSAVAGQVVTAGVASNAAPQTAGLQVVSTNYYPLTYGSTTYQNAEIEVTLSYKVPNLIVLGYLLGNGSNTSSTQTIVEKAFVCLPGQSGFTNGYCVRPDGS